MCPSTTPVLKFTLDTNCIIDLEENRPAATSVRALVAAHAAGLADVALVAVSASERQPGDVFLDNYHEFQLRIAKLGFAQLRILQPMLNWDAGFWDVGLYSDEEMIKLERSIHQTLFSSIAFEWAEFAANVGVPLDAIKSSAAKRWRNAFCDRQMFWAHLHNGRDVFVTSDADFRRKLSRSVEFSRKQIVTPGEAATMLSTPASN